MTRKDYINLIKKSKFYDDFLEDDAENSEDKEYRDWILSAVSSKIAARYHCFPRDAEEEKEIAGQIKIALGLYFETGYFHFCGENS
jgi:hypothetical protein